MDKTFTMHVDLNSFIPATGEEKEWFYNKCWGREAERQSYTQHLL